METLRSAYATKFAGGRRTHSIIHLGIQGAFAVSPLHVDSPEDQMLDIRQTCLGLPHQDTCPFCAEQDGQSTTFSRAMFSRGLSGGKSVEPQACQGGHHRQMTYILDKWCVSVVGGGHKSRDIRAILTLTMWELSKHRNAIVFDGATPLIQHVISRMITEGQVWR